MSMKFKVTYQVEGMGQRIAPIIATSPQGAMDEVASRHSSYSKRAIEITRVVVALQGAA